MNFLSRFLSVVFDSMVLDGVGLSVLNDETGSKILISRLTDAANIDHALFIAQFEKVITLIRLNKRTRLREHSWNVRVTLEAKMVESLH